MEKNWSKKPPWKSTFENPLREYVTIPWEEKWQLIFMHTHKFSHRHVCICVCQGAYKMMTQNIIQNLTQWQNNRIYFFRHPYVFRFVGARGIYKFSILFIVSSDFGLFFSHFQVSFPLLLFLVLWELSCNSFLSCFEF